VEQGQFPAEALAILDAGPRSAGQPVTDGIDALVSTTEQILTMLADRVTAELSLRAA
jgi:hypothetical protein